MRVDLNGVIASVADASEEVSNLINQMQLDQGRWLLCKLRKPSLSSLEQASASTMEHLQAPCVSRMMLTSQELLQVQDKSLLSGIASLKESPLS